MSLVNSTESNTSTYALQQPSRAGKIPKPVMEKRRRARINRCLEELKGLVPDLTVSGARVDKADVLEMTVEHLTKMRTKRRYVTPPPAVVNNPHQQFSHGYQQCMAEVTKLLLSSTVDESVTSKLVEHLTKRNIASRQFDFINIPQHTTTPQHSTSQLSTSQLSTSQLSTSQHSTHYSQIPDPFPSYPSPPNSPVFEQPVVSCAIIGGERSCESVIPQYPVMRLPSVARRPQPQRAPALWRPW